MGSVRWTDEALKDLDDILADIEQHNPMAAIDLVETIIASGNSLRTLPARYPIRHQARLRERPVLGTRYILLYRIEREDLVLIMAVRRGAREVRAPSRP